jgi:2-C-methyl-D-erythritol 4-phosphate cytidylyltransferase
MSNNRIAVVVAGGSGSRMGIGTPKQFLIVEGKPVLMHTLERFKSCDELVVVLPENEIAHWHQLVAEYSFELKHSLVSGGANRYQSVRNGLRQRKLDGIVAVHDGVRPFISEAFIRFCFDQAEAFGTAIPFIDIPDTLREKVNDELVAADRSRFKLIQTPQCFRTEYIETAYASSDGNRFTDDATVLEHAGITLHFIPGERWNMKITFKDDLDLAEALTKKMNHL